MTDRRKPGKRVIINVVEGKCVTCGTVENLTLHHILPPDAASGTDNKDNLEILCEFHQKKLHGTDQKKSDFK